MDDRPDDFEVQIFVNDVEMTKAGAGMGMDPYAVLIPENRFRATRSRARSASRAASAACTAAG